MGTITVPTTTPHPHPHPPSSPPPPPPTIQPTPTPTHHPAHPHPTPHPATQTCSKTCLVTVLIRSIFAREKLHERFSASAVFQRKIERINTASSKTCFALITHLLSIRETTSWKMLMNNKFKAQTLTGNPTGNYRCQLFASRALNMSCYFSQSARSIESRCVVIPPSHPPPPSPTPHPTPHTHTPNPNPTTQTQTTTQPRIGDDVGQLFCNVVTTLHKGCPTFSSDDTTLP